MAAIAASAPASAPLTTLVEKTGAIFVSIPLLRAWTTTTPPPCRSPPRTASMNSPRTATATASTTTTDAVRGVP